MERRTCRMSAKDGKRSSCSNFGTICSNSSKLNSVPAEHGSSSMLRGTFIYVSLAPSHLLTEHTDSWENGFYCDEMYEGAKLSLYSSKEQSASIITLIHLGEQSWSGHLAEQRHPS